MFILFIPENKRLSSNLINVYKYLVGENDEEGDRCLLTGQEAIGIIKNMKLHCNTGKHLLTLPVIRDLERSWSFIFTVYPILHCEGVEALKEVAQRSCGGSVEGQVGWGIEHVGLVGGVPATVGGLE